MTISDAAGSIQLLSGLEAVRKRPGMYIGATDARGMHGLLFSLIGNSAAHGVAKPGINIRITIETDGSACVADDAEGIADRGLGNDGIPITQTLLTSLFACGKPHRSPFQNPFGIDLPVVIALSEFLSIRTHNARGSFKMHCHKGRVQTPWQESSINYTPGTRISLKPDPDIFGNQAFDLARVKTFCRDLVRIQPNVQFDLADFRGSGNKSILISSKHDILESLQELDTGYRSFPDRAFHLSPTFPVRDIAPRVLAAALAFTDRRFARITSFVNFAQTTDGGSHVEGFKQAVEVAFHMMDVPRPQRTALHRSLSGVIHVLHPAPNWEGCTRSRVNTPELKALVHETLAPRLAVWIKEELWPHLRTGDNTRETVQCTATSG